MHSLHAAQRTLPTTAKRAKVSPWMDLHTFQVAAQGIASALYAHDEELMHSYAAFIAWLSGYWTQIPCTVLMQYERSVREWVTLGQWDSFAHASVNDALWLQIVHPHETREAQFPQHAHCLEQRVPAEARCPYFLQGGCTHHGKASGTRMLCPFGFHVCDRCGHRNDSAPACPACAAPAAQAYRASLNARAPAYVPRAQPAPQPAPQQSQAQLPPDFHAAVTAAVASAMRRGNRGGEKQRGGRGGGRGGRGGGSSQ